MGAGIGGATMRRVLLSRFISRVDTYFPAFRRPFSLVAFNNGLSRAYPNTKRPTIGFSIVSAWVQPVKKYELSTTLSLLKPKQ